MSDFETERGNVVLGHRIIATDVTYKDFLEHFAGHPVEWEQPRQAEVVATGIAYEEFLDRFEGQHVEWVYGTVIRMSPIHQRHDDLVRFLENLFQVFLELIGGGRVLQEPMTMRLGPDLPIRQPDLQVLVASSLHRLAPTSVEGPSDLVVEVVSPESSERDRGEKFSEYERGGVGEYWIIDDLRQDSLFYVLENGIFRARYPDERGIYHSSVLSRLALPLELLWRDPLPGYIETLELVQSMLKQD